MKLKDPELQKQLELMAAEYDELPDWLKFDLEEDKDVPPIWRE